MIYFRDKLKKTSKHLPFMHQFSHEAVRKWWLRMKPSFDLRKEKRRCLAVNETKIKINVEWIWIWAVIDRDSKEILATYVSYTRSSMDIYTTMRKALKWCRNKPKVLVDGGNGIFGHFLKLDLPWDHVTMERKELY